jgi:excisionase family DNA binding protein
MPKTINLDLVKSADARRKRAKRINPNVTARAVPIGELVQRGRVTITVPELATLTGLHPLTIRRAIAAGELKAANGGGRSHYRISRTDAETWWQGRGGGTLLGDAVPLDTPVSVDTPQMRAAAILADLDSDDTTRRNAAIIALANADAQTSELVESEVEKSVAAYDGPEDDFSDWRALDSEFFHFPEEEERP